MKRVFIGILTATLVVAFAFASGAEAKGKKKRGKKRKGPPESSQIVKSMGDLKWGTSEKKLVKSLTDKNEVSQLRLGLRAGPRLAPAAPFGGHRDITSLSGRTETDP